MRRRVEFVGRQSAGRIKTPLDDIEVPESVAEPIVARAKFHGFAVSPRTGRVD